MMFIVVMLVLLVLLVWGSHDGGWGSTLGAN